MEAQTVAMTNRSLRTIRAELEFLADSSAITTSQLSSILSQLPSESNHRNPHRNPTPTPTQNPLSAPTSQFAAPTLNEKQNQSFYAPTPSPAALPPPAYASFPTPTPAATVPASLASASALYEYQPSDAGDLALHPNDRIAITEFMNADWAKGRNERTGQEGIFPRSYVNIVEDEKKSTVNGLVPPPPQTPSGYGNAPLEVSQGGGGAVGADGKESKMGANGKKFGKKMGNAAIFGAGATIGSSIVSGIF